MSDRTAFITGSHAYGMPGPNSDVDLVIYCSEETREKLVRLLHEQTDDDAEYGAGCVQFKVGGLNLIMVTDLVRYESWRCGTEQLKAATIGYLGKTRDEAVEVFKALFAAEPPRP